jgi:hypothetical protein
MKITTKRFPKKTTVAAAVAGSILVLTGCGSGDPAPSAAPASAGTPASAAAVTGDCKAAVESFRVLVAGLFKSALATEGANGDEQAATRKALTDYAAKAREQAAKVADPALRTALETHATAASKLSTSADPTDLEDPGFTKGSEQIEKVCADALTPKASPGTPTTRIGTAGSACELPVSFDLLALWKPKAIDLSELGKLAGLYRNGPFEAVCEVDGKPAGEIGFLRVYVAEDYPGSPRSYLKTFVATESPEAVKAGNMKLTKSKYTELTIGGEPAAEVTYETYNKSMDHASKYSAFALKTPQGAVVVKLSPFGADEHVNVLPAYEKAKKTLTVNG